MTTLEQKAVEKDSFYIVTRESGFHNPSLPTWTDNLKEEQVFDSKFDKSKVERVDLPEVPGAFQ